MATVVEFPSRHRQALAFLEQQVRELMASRGADQELVDYAAQTVRDIYARNAGAENYSFSVTLPESLDKQEAMELQAALEHGVEQIRAENHALVVRLVAELALAELRNFQARRDD